MSKRTERIVFVEATDPVSGKRGFIDLYGICEDPEDWLAFCSVRQAAMWIRGAFLRRHRRAAKPKPVVFRRVDPHS